MNRISIGILALVNMLIETEIQIFFQTSPSGNVITWTRATSSSSPRPCPPPSWAWPSRRWPRSATSSSTSFCWPSKPGVNFINILHTYFTLAHPKCVKNNWRLTVFLRFKGVHKMLVKLIPGVNFINILCPPFTPADPISAKIESNCQSFLHFWDLRALKLCIKHWWNWTLVSI